MFQALISGRYKSCTQKRRENVNVDTYNNEHFLNLFFRGTCNTITCIITALLCVQFVGGYIAAENVFFSNEYYLLV